MIPYNQADPTHFRQKKSNLNFVGYRHFGRGVQQDPDVNHPAFAAFQVPAPGQYAGVRLPVGGQGQPVTRNYPVLVNLNAPNPNNPNNPPPGPPIWRIKRHDKPDGLDEGVEYLKGKLASRWLGKAKVLGYGGNGLALRVESLRSGSREQYVAKYNWKGTNESAAALMRERTKTDWFENAMHMVQLRPYPDVVSRRQNPHRLDRPTQITNWPPGSSENDDFVLLEYCHRGSLDKALVNVYKARLPINSGGKDLSFPDRVLWSIFHCLVKSLIAMAFPPEHPLFQPAYNGLQPPYRERIPPSNGPHPPTKLKCIHFDIDPQNVLVGDTSAGSGHGVVPSMKLSDFGLAQFVVPDHMTDMDTMLTFRRYAKQMFFVPEQFTEEWDFLPPGMSPREVGTRPKTAGNFGWRTNLCQIGYVMLCLITKHYPPLPPHPSRIRIPPFAQADFDDDDRPEHPAWGPPEQLRHPAGDAAFNAPVPDLDAQTLNGPEVRANWPRVWSYGGYILDDSNPLYARVHRPLRLLVAQCLADDPFWRPRLRQLDTKIATEMRSQGWPTEEDVQWPHQTDQVVREWVRECLDRSTTYYKEA